jgi:guanylate kinase
MTRQGILIVLSGPSGAGKGTICQEVLRELPELNFSISATTRLPRAGEQNGVNYWFVAQEEFKNMIRQDDLLEWAEVYGNYYGTPRRYVMEMLEKGQDVVLEIDTQGAMQIKDKFPDGVFIFIVPPSLDELGKRIHKRGTETPEVIKKRLSCAANELTYAEKYNYVIINDEVNKAVRCVESILTAERCRVNRNVKLIKEILQSHCDQ